MTKACGDKLLRTYHMDNPFSERLRMEFASNRKKHVTHIFPGPRFVVVTDDGR